MRGTTELIDALAASLEALADDAEVTVALTRLCQEACQVLPADGAAVCLVDEEGRMRTVAASDETIHRIEVLQQVLGEGPCNRTIAEDAPVLVDDLAQGPDRWPGFASATQLAGMRAVTCLPVRGTSGLVGALCLFRRDPARFSVDDLALGQLFARLAGAYVVVDRRRARTQEVVEQLQYALTSRVAIEQAKGMLAVRFAISVDDAFDLIRKHARTTNQKADAVARLVLDGHLLDKDPLGRLHA